MISAHAEQARMRLPLIFLWTLETCNEHSSVTARTIADPSTNMCGHKLDDGLKAIKLAIYGKRQKCWFTVTIIYKLAINTYSTFTRQ